MSGDRVIYQLQNGKMVRTADPVGRDMQCNFVIVCDYGDWSGFRNLPECERQFPEIQQMAFRNCRPDGFYRVVERL